MSKRSINYKQLADLFARYIALAGIEPDDSFTENEIRWISGPLTKRKRELAIRNWKPTQPTSTRRIRAFLVYNSEYSFSRAEIARATRDPFNTVCSALHRLFAMRLVMKASYGRYEARIERPMAMERAA